MSPQSEFICKVSSQKPFKRNFVLKKTKLVLNSLTVNYFNLDQTACSTVVWSLKLNRQEFKTNFVFSNAKFLFIGLSPGVSCVTKHLYWLDRVFSRGLLISDLNVIDLNLARFWMFPLQARLNNTSGLIIMRMVSTVAYDIALCLTLFDKIIEVS